MIFYAPSKEIPDETPSTYWSVTARVYYDSATDETGSLVFHRIGGSTGVVATVHLKKGQGNSVDVGIIESVSYIV